jgi:FkbM family methyltransferase
MFNFSGISKAGLAGRLFRLPLALIPPKAVVRILQGKLRGYRWIVGAETHGCWLGSYELAKQRQFGDTLKESDIVYDIGANVGFYSLLASRCVGSTGQVHAFEPLPENLVYLEKHIRLNQCTNVSIHRVAVSDRSAKLCFQQGSNRSTGQLAEHGDLEVNAISLDEFVYRDSNSVPNIVKIDVEGAEVQVLHGARRLLQSNPPIIFLATHSSQLHATCCELLLSAGYRLEGVDGRQVEMTNELICYPAKH